MHVYRADDGWRLSDADEKARDARNRSYMVDDPIETYLDLNYTLSGAQHDHVPAHAILSIPRPWAAHTEMTQGLSLRGPKGRHLHLRCKCR